MCYQNIELGVRLLDSIAHVSPIYNTPIAYFAAKTQFPRGLDLCEER